MVVPTERLPIRHAASDGFKLALTIFRPKNSSDITGSVVFANATGVQARFYHAFASFLSTQGIAAYTFDYRFSGASFPEHLDARKLAEDEDYFEAALRECPDTVDLTNTWCRVDLASVVKLAYSTHPDKDVTVIGHSLGGHLMIVLPRDHIYGPVARVTRMLNVCGGNAYYKNNSNPVEAEFGFTEMVVKPLIEEHIFKASNLGLGYDLPYGPGVEWSDWYFHPHFAFNRRENMDLARSFTGVPLLYVGFEDDDRIGKHMMQQYMRLLNHADGMKRSLWVNPAARKPRWDTCAHVNAFTKSKRKKGSDEVPVEHGEGYAPKTSATNTDAPAQLKREESIWLLFLAYIRGEQVDPADDEYKLWTPADERDIEAERRAEDDTRRGRPSRLQQAALDLDREKRQQTAKL